MDRTPTFGFHETNIFHDTTNVRALTNSISHIVQVTDIFGIGY